MVTTKLALETTERIQNVGTNRDRLVPFMNPLKQFSTTEGEHNRGRVPSHTVNEFSNLSSFNYILISHAIGDLGRLHVYEIAVGDDSPTRLHRHGDRSLDLDVMDEPEL